MKLNKTPIMWLTGMSGSGKSTLASGVKAVLSEKNYKISILDGDAIRNKDENILGFGCDDVLRNNIRISNAAKKTRAKYDLILIPVIGPYDKVRSEIRRALEPNFHLIYVKTDIQSLRDRDTKGLYHASDMGLINDLIGYSDVNPYDEPTNAELVIDASNNVSLDYSKRMLLDYIDTVMMINHY